MKMTVNFMFVGFTYDKCISFFIVIVQYVLCLNCFNFVVLFELIFQKKIAFLAKKLIKLRNFNLNHVGIRAAKMRQFRKFAYSC